ncbi:MAG: thiamine pyrophosphate-binding protein [Ilumatobacteraceae bacterium]
MTRLSGGEAVLRMFQLYGVEYSFGMGGFQPLPFYDALARQEIVRHVLIRDEKHGSFAADAYARVKGRPCVADATVGPGATNLVSGAAESFGASIPQILLTADINRSIATRGATQESDQVSMLRPTSRATIQIDRIERIPELIRRAFTSANVGRPGPVHVNIPEDVFHGVFEFDDDEFYVAPGTDVVGGIRVRPDAAAIERAAALIDAADRPVILAGGGLVLSEAFEPLERLSTAIGAPVATSISGKGSIAENNPLALGVVGRFSRTGNDFVEQADVLIVVGCKLGEIVTRRWSLIAPDTQIVHIDIDPTEPGRVYRTEAPVWGDAALALADLADAVSPRPERAADVAGRVAAARSEWSAGAESSFVSDELPMPMPRVLRTLQEVLPARSIIVADGGFAAHWSALLYDINLTGRHYVANRGHAAIGYGLPGAIGAKLAAPDLPVVALCGDNGFAMAVAELETAKRIGAPIVCVVVNNQALGYVKALQHSMYAERYVSVDFLDVDYAAVAKGFGCDGVRVRTHDELAIALRAGLASDVPYVIDAIITSDAGKMLPGIDTRTVAS